MEQVYTYITLLLFHAGSHSACAYEGMKIMANYKGCNKTLAQK